MVDETRLREVREAKARFGEQLLRNPDVHGVGVGRRRRGGGKTDELAIVVHVQRKLSESQVASSRLIPKSFQFTTGQGDEVEVPVDVVEQPIPIPEVDCGDCRANLEERVRPVPGGYSGGPPTAVSNGGTLGGWVWDNVTDQVVVISNDHVFGGAAGTDISQPSVFDGGSLPTDRIADVLRSGTLDASIAAPVSEDVYELAIECGGPAVYEIADAQIDMIVQKTGQTTGLTCGIVELIDYDSDHYGSDSDLWIDGDGNDFSMGGDSGSLYLERDHPDGAGWRRVVGIHWGGAGDDGVGHPIRAVFDDLDLTTVCAGLVNRLLEMSFRRREEVEIEEAEHRLAGLSRLARPSPAEVGEFRGGRFPPERPHPSALDVGGFVAPRWPWRVPGRRTFAREVQKRLGEMDAGGKLVSLIHRNRSGAVRLLLNPDGRRAAIAGLAPVAERVVTTDDLLDHEVTETDVANVQRLLKVAERLAGDDMAEIVEFVTDLISRGAGRKVGELLR